MSLISRLERAARSERENSPDHQKARADGRFAGAKCCSAARSSRPISDITPVYSITWTGVTSNADGTYRPSGAARAARRPLYRGRSASVGTKPGPKKPKKAAAGQKEMLLPIAGKKPAREAGTALNTRSPRSGAVGQKRRAQLHTSLPIRTASLHIFILARAASCIEST